MLVGWIDTLIDFISLVLFNFKFCYTSSNKKGLGDFIAFCSFWGVKTTGLLLLWLELLSILMYLIFNCIVLIVDFSKSISSHYFIVKYII